MYDLYPNQRATGEVTFDGEDILSSKQDLNLLRSRIGMVFLSLTSSHGAARRNAPSTRASSSPRARRSYRANPNDLYVTQRSAHAGLNHRAVRLARSRTPQRRGTRHAALKNGRRGCRAQRAGWLFGARMVGRSADIHRLKETSCARYLPLEPVIAA